MIPFFMLFVIAFVMFVLGFLIRSWAPGIYVAIVAVAVITALAAISQPGLNAYPFIALVAAIIALLVGNESRFAVQAARRTRFVLVEARKRAEMRRIANSLSHRGIYPYGKMPEDER